MRVVVAAISALILAGARMWATDAFSGHANSRLSLEELLWHSERCGPNALYMLLRLSGSKSLDLRDFRSIPLSKQGSSLLALKEWARTKHINLEAVRYDTNGLKKVPLPAILHFDGKTAIDTSHFVVCYKVERGSAYLIDGSTGTLYQMPANSTRDGDRAINTRWSGAALICQVDAFEGLPGTMARAVLGAWSVALFACGARGLSSRRTTVPNDTRS
jgi:hypothetical protein